MPNVDEVFDMLTSEELDHVEFGRPASFVRSVAERSGAFITAEVVAAINSVYKEIRGRLGLPDQGLE